MPNRARRATATSLTADEKKSTTVSDERTLKIFIVDGRAGTTSAVRRVINELSDEFESSLSYCTQGTFLDRDGVLYKRAGILVEISVAEEEQGGDLE